MAEVTIYALSDPLYPTVIRYIGKTKFKLSIRLSNHITCVKRHKCHRSAWIQSLLKQGRRPIIWPVELCSKDNWAERERFWIYFFKPTGWLTNHRDGGDGVHEIRKPMSIEQRKSISLRRLGKRLTMEQRELRKRLLRMHPRTDRQREQFWTMLKTRKPRVVTPEGRAKYSKSRKGVPRTEKQKRQILDCVKLRQKAVVCISTGEIFESESAACEHLGVNHYKIANAIRRNGTCGKMKWAYATKHESS